MKERLSITIVAYRNYDDIRNAIKSIEDYTDPVITKRIYIIDNSEWHKGENDPLVKEFKAFLSAFPDLEYLYTGENLGFGKGNNCVLPILSSEYHAIVNPDIILTSDTFSSMIQFLDRNTDVGMCVPRIIDENGSLQPVYRQELTVFDMFIRMFCKGMFPKRQAYHTMQYVDYSKPFLVPFAQGSFLVIRTQLFRELNGFDERFFMYVEDADLCKRLNQISTLMYYPGASVIHKWKKGSHKNKKLFSYHVQSMMIYFKKWGYKWF